MAINTTNQNTPQLSGAGPNAPRNTGSTGNPTPTSQPAPAPKSAPAGVNLGILGHIAIHALAGAVRGLQAQQPSEPASDDGVATGAPVEADEPAAPVASAQAEQPVQNPRGQQPVDRRTLATAQVQHYALQNIRMAHDIDVAKKSDPHGLQILQAQATSAQLNMARNLQHLGLRKVISGLRSYREATELGLAKKLARGQIISLADPDGGVDVYELSPDAMYAPTTKPIEIRNPVGLDRDGNAKWEVVGTVPPGGMTKMEALTQIVLPEQRAAAELIRIAMTARANQ